MTQKKLFGVYWLFHEFAFLQFIFIISERSGGKMLSLAHPKVGTEFNFDFKLGEL